MSSTIFEAMELVDADIHAVGSLSNWNKDVVNLGAIVQDDAIDNWEIVELEITAAGNRECKQLTANGNKGYLIASVEDYIEGMETIKNFYNMKGERARIVRLKPGMRFECSNYTAAADVAANPIKNGNTVHFDIPSKTFMIGNNGQHPEYGAAGHKFVVVDAEGNYLDGQHTIRFEVVE